MENYRAPVSRTPTSCCSSPTARTPTCSSRNIFSYAQRKRLCALAFAKTRQNLRARAAELQPVLAQARHRDPPRPARATDARVSGRAERPATAASPTRGASAASGARRASSRTRSTTSSASSPRAELTTPEAHRVRSPTGEQCLFGRPGGRLGTHRAWRRRKRTAPHARTHPRDQPRAVQPPWRAARHDRGHRRRDEHQPGQSLLPLPQQGRDHRRALRRVRSGRRAAAGRAGDRAPHVEDLWFLLHLLFERMWEYRFLYRDLDEITSRNRKLALRLADLLRRGAGHRARVVPRSRARRETMRATEREIAALASNAVLIATYWMSFQRLIARAGGARRDAGRRPRASPPITCSRCSRRSAAATVAR